MMREEFGGEKNIHAHLRIHVKVLDFLVCIPQVSSALFLSIGEIKP